MSDSRMFGDMEIVREMQQRFTAAESRDELRQAIAEARRAGWSWGDIASVLGMSRDLVHVLAEAEPG